MKILVTGGAGFIGSHLVEHLYSLGAEIVIFDKSDRQPNTDFIIDKYHYVEGNIQDRLKLGNAAKNCNVIVHLAGIMGTDYLVDFPELAVKVNILGTINALNVAHDIGAVMLFVSLLPEWNNPYMISKNAAEGFCQMYHSEFGVKTIIIKATHVYGPRQKWSPVKKAVPTFILNALNGDPLNIYGSGEQLMDLIYVTDAVRALAKCIETTNTIGKTIELGSGKGISVTSLAHLISELCGSRSIIKYAKMRPGEPDEKSSFEPANTHLTTSLLDFYPNISVRQGLQNTIEWYKKYGKKLKIERE